MNKRSMAGWIGFAGIVMLVIGFIDFFQGLIALFKDDYYVVTQSGFLAIDLTGWGWVMIIWGVLLVLAGFALLNGSVLGPLVHDLRRRRELLRAARVPRQQPVPALGTDRPRAQRHRALRADGALERERSRPRLRAVARAHLWRPSRAAVRDGLCTTFALVSFRPSSPRDSLAPVSAFHHTVKTVTPFHDRSRHSRLLKIALWLVGIAVALVICHVAGFDVLGWFASVWDTMKEIAPVYIVAGVFFQTIQTTLTALAWYFILAAGYPDGGVRYRDILAAYAAGRRDERVPAGEHRHVCLAADVRRAHPRRRRSRASSARPSSRRSSTRPSARSCTSTSSCRCRARSICSSGSSITIASSYRC